MNRKFEALLELVSAWPAAAQDELVKCIADINARYTDIYRLDDEERAAIEKALAAVERGELATDDEVAAVFDRFR
jgi:hypothetical protein